MASTAACMQRSAGRCLRPHAAAAHCRSRATTVSVRAGTVITEQVTLKTAKGDMLCQVYRPSAPGRYPGLVLYSEIFQITDPIARSSRIMAGHGFVVVVPEIYHEFLPAGTVLSYSDPKGAETGNDLKITKELSSYDSDAQACVKWLRDGAGGNGTGKVGVMGFCIGGILSYRAALNKDVIAGACIYPTDIHKGSLAKGGDDSILRAGDFAAHGTELLFVWGKQDPHIPKEGRQKVWKALEDAGVNFTWHEFNGQHAFMRDEGPRYDPENALQVYGLLVSFFRRKLSDGFLPPNTAEGAKESKH